MGGGFVRAVILDASVVLNEGDNEFDMPSLSLRPGVESLLRKLRHAKIRTGVSYRLDLSTHKVNLLKKMATQYSFDCFILNASCIDDSIHEVMLAWGDDASNIVYLVSNDNKDIFLKLHNCGWLIIVPRSIGQRPDNDVEIGSAWEDSSLVIIDKLEELPLTVCQLNKKATGKDLVTVAYVMKPSREEDFAKRGAFPLHPTHNGLLFVPLMLELPLSSQLQEVDVILHKATDEVISIELSNSLELPNRITYTRGMEELKRYMEHHPDFCAIDPLDKIYPVLDRLKIQQILHGLKDLNMENHCTIRAPHFLKVDTFKDPDLAQRLSEAKLSLPSIVKPQVACGVADAHNMAIVYRVEDFKDLSIPLPAVIQEYVDHSSTLYKIYVLGEQVFYSVKKSTPNSAILINLSESNGLKPLVFDSLKSLPIAEDNQPCGDGICSKVTNQCFALGMVTRAAQWLMKTLDLTVFGFDVVIQEGTGDHVIVDVNYLPSFKEVPDEIAIPAFWNAIKCKFEASKINKQ